MREPPADSPASSYRLVRPTFPPIEKWTIASLKLTLTKSNIQPSHKLNKAELYELYKNLHPTNRSPEPSPASKATKRKSKPPVAPTPPSSSCAGPHVTPATAQPSTTAPPRATPGPAVQASDWSLPPPVSFSSEPTAQASAWPHLLPDSAPLPATSNSELAAQASTWSHWLSHTAPPPAPVSSGSQLKPALGRIGCHTQPHRPPPSAQGSQTKRKLGRTGRHL
ncbi:hypothetical protein M9458_043128, partial [Cirrhinus mrigala]